MQRGRVGTLGILSMSLGPSSSDSGPHEDLDGLELRARSGDPKAAARFYRQLHRLAAWRARRAGLVDEDGISDVSQNTSIRFFLSLQRMTPDHPARFITVLAKRAAIDYRRRAARISRREVAVGDSPLTGAMDRSSDPEIVLAAGEDARRALRLAGKQCLELINLIHVQGVTYRQIADEEGVPLGTVSSRASRCLEKARKYLKEHGYNS